MVVNEYIAMKRRVIDGATIEAKIILGFGVVLHNKIKLEDVITSNFYKDRDSREAAIDAKKYLDRITPAKFKIRVVEGATNAAGGIFAQCWDGPKCLNNMVVENGMGKWRGDRKTGFSTPSVELYANMYG